MAPGTTLTLKNRLPSSRHGVETVVYIASGEVVLFWDLPAPDAARRARRLREELASLDVEEFIDRWAGTEQEA